MFCNVYFGNIESFLLEDVFEKGSSRVIRGCCSSNCDATLIKSNEDLHFLVRIVDDYLLISTNKDTSIRFLKKLNRGIPSIGLKINSAKSRVNYPLTLKNLDTCSLESVSSCQNSNFPWCGLLINTSTCEISLDYHRFSRLQAIDTVTIHRAGHEGLNLKKKMKDFVRPRCSQKLLFSSCMNSIDRIRLNFYQTFLLCAIKTIHYIKNGSNISSPGHMNFIYISACDTIQFAFLLISSKVKNSKVSDIAAHCDNEMSLQLAWQDAFWLGKHAFSSVFRSVGKDYAKLGRTFYEESRALNRKDLLSVAKRSLKLFPVEVRI